MPKYYGMEIQFPTEEKMNNCIEALRERTDIKVHHSDERTQDNDVFYLLWALGNMRTPEHLQEFINTIPDENTLGAWTFEIDITSGYIKDFFK